MTLATGQKFFICFPAYFIYMLSCKPVRGNVTEVDALHNLEAIATCVHTYTESYVKCIDLQCDLNDFNHFIDKRKLSAWACYDHPNSKEMAAYLWRNGCLFV